MRIPSPESVTGKRNRRQPGPVPTVPRSCSAGVFIGLTVILFLVVAPVVVYLVEYRACSRLEPTGDELYDAYCWTVTRRWAPQLYRSNEQWLLPARLNLKQVEELEKRFADDPRFWLLCYQFAGYPDEGLRSKSVDQGLDPSVYYLDQAIERGVADAGISWTLLNEYMKKWKDEITDERLQEYEDAHPEIKTWTARMYLVVEDHGEEIFTLLAEVIRLDQDNSYPYYAKAYYCYLAGDTDDAWNMLELGNSCEQNRLIRQFPMTFVADELERSGDFPNQLVTSTAMVYADVITSGPVEMNSGYTEFGRHVAAAESRERMQVFHEFARRYATLENTSNIGIIMGGNVHLGLMRGLLIDRCDSLTADEREEIYNLNNRIKTATGKTLAIRHEEKQLEDAYNNTPVTILNWHDSFFYLDPKSLYHVFDVSTIGYIGIKEIQDYYLEVSDFDFSTMSRVYPEPVPGPNDT